MKFYPGFRSFDLFDDFFDDDFGLTASSQLMKTDICEKNGNYELSMEVPGIKKEDIQLELKDGYLNVTPTTKKKIRTEKSFVRNVLLVLVHVASMLVKPLKKKISKQPLTMVN